MKLFYLWRTPWSGAISVMREIERAFSISPKEEDLMEQAGFLPITLGPRILRTELAPVYIMSAISYETELGE